MSYLFISRRAARAKRKGKEFLELLSWADSRDYFKINTDGGSALLFSQCEWGVGCSRMGSPEEPTWRDRNDQGDSFWPQEMLKNENFW